MMKGLFFLAIICITSVKAGVFCNPYFLEIPRVTQVDIQTVYLSWNISCWLDCCPTYFVVKYWEHKYTINTCFPHPDGRKYAYCLKPKPDWKYQYTEHIPLLLQIMYAENLQKTYKFVSDFLQEHRNA